MVTNKHTKVTLKDYFKIPSKAPNAWLLYENSIVLLDVLVKIITIFFLRPMLVVPTCLGDCSNQTENSGVQYVVRLLNGVEIVSLILFLIQIIYNTYVLTRKKPKLHVLKIIKTALLAITPVVFYLLITLFLTFFYATTLPDIQTPRI